MDQLMHKIPGVQFNGLSADLEKQLVYCTQCVLPLPGDHNEMMLFNLDINGICASGWQRLFQWIITWVTRP